MVPAVALQAEPDEAFIPAVRARHGGDRRARIRERPGRYHGSFSGTASSVAVSPDGTKVFVTGELISLGPPGVPTMQTLAYKS